MTYKATIRTEITLEDLDGEQGTTLDRYAWEKEFTLQEELKSLRVAVNAATEKTIWDSSAGSEPLDDFDFLFLVADQDCDLEIGVSGAASATSVRLKAGQPIVLGADDAYYNDAAVDAFAGTLSTITSLAILAGANAVKLRGWLGS